MKKIVWILSLVIISAGAAKAQIAQKSPEQRASHITRVLQKRLNLTAEQASAVNTAFLNQATRMDSLKNNLSADKKLNAPTRRSIVLATQKNVMAVLNEEQQKQFLQLEKMRKEKLMEKRAQKTNIQG